MPKKGNGGSGNSGGAGSGDNSPPAEPPPQPIQQPPAAAQPTQPKGSSSLPTVVERILQDVPYCYLVDKSNWTDFKRTLNNCGYTWNLPDWMHTVVYQGKQYTKIASEKPDIKEFFQEPVFQLEGKVLAPKANKEY